MTQGKNFLPMKKSARPILGHNGALLMTALHTLSFSREQKNALPVIADLHLHTSHSHGQNTTEDMYRACIGRGLRVVGFSEHSPRPLGYGYPVDYQNKLKDSFPLYVSEVGDIAGRAGRDGAHVLLGLEVDYIPGQEAYARALCEAYPFDYIIGGLHFQGQWGFDFSADDWKNTSRDEHYAVFSRYYDDLASMCRTGLFHIAAHPDLIKIFSVDMFRDWLETPRALPAIRNALDAMKDCGVILEISSAGLRKPCREIYPGPKIMELAAKLDLPISFASDAHCINTPAFAFDELARYASSFGYRESCIVIQGEVHCLPFTSPPLL